MSSSSTSRCEAVACMTRLASPKLMCNKHWKQLPTHLQHLILDLYDFRSSNQSSEFNQAIGLAINHIAHVEGRDKKEIEDAAL